MCLIKQNIIIRDNTSANNNFFSWEKNEGEVKKDVVCIIGALDDIVDYNRLKVCDVC